MMYICVGGKREDPYYGGDVLALREDVDGDGWDDWIIDRETYFTMVISGGPENYRIDTLETGNVRVDIYRNLLSNP